MSVPDYDRASCQHFTRSKAADLSSKQLTDRQERAEAGVLVRKFETTNPAQLS